MIVLEKKVKDLTRREMISILHQLRGDGYLEEGEPVAKGPKDIVECVLEIVDYEGIEVFDGAQAFNVIAIDLGTTDCNGFDQWSFKGIDANMRRWYSEWYCNGTPEDGNGYEFDVLHIQ